jgi:hypothetical protein
MTHTTYTQQQLQLKSIARLKEIYSQIGATVEVTDKRCKDSWINAITAHQSSQLHKVDEQAIAVGLSFAYRPSRTRDIY